MLFVGVPHKFGPFLPFALVPSGHPAAVWMGKLFGQNELVAACRLPGVVVEETWRYFFGCFIGLLMSKVPAPGAIIP